MIAKEIKNYYNPNARKRDLALLKIKENTMVTTLQVSSKILPQRLSSIAGLVQLNKILKQ